MIEVTEDSVRLDLWLWAARFYKTRAIAQKAITGGHVELNEQAVSKPARALKIGDRLRLTMHHQRLELQVLGLSAKRASAPVAQALYAETEASRQAREAAAELRRLQGRVGPQSRPEGRDRRVLRSLKEGG
ncbi:MAG: RNA-binding S4 domain-containing protein [Lysobacterales bacterium]